MRRYDMRKLFSILAIAAIALSLLPSAVFADASTKYKVGDKIVFGNSIEGTIQSIDLKTNKAVMKATIEAPIYLDDLKTTVKTNWQATTKGFTTKDNLFDATVTGSQVTTKCNGKTMSWTPVLTVGDTAIAPEAAYIDFDHLNPNYGTNTITWKYGDVAYRYLRQIEGVLMDYYVFDKAPAGDIVITEQVSKTAGYAYDRPAYAHDANGKQIKIIVEGNSKIVKLADLADVKYPITIDPTNTYYTSASDGYGTVQSNGANICAAFDSAHDSVSSTSSDTSSTWNYIAYVSLANFPSFSIYAVDIARGVLYFDTSALEGATITGATLSLYSYGAPIYSAGLGAWNLRIQNGQPTYPHDPLVANDFNYTYYSGNGGSIAGSNFSTSGYKSINLTADGLTWINKTGTTKLCLREVEHDINDSCSGYGSDVQNINYAGVYCYEKGAGYRPKLDITYTVAVPIVATSAATSTACTTVQMNGEITSLGGENSDERGFVWDTASRAAPGNVAPAASGYSDNISAYGSFGVGVFSYTGATLAEDTTYYYRAMSHNSAGYAYGDEASFETWGDPVITTNAASDIVVTAARLQSYINNDNGDTTCQVRWGYGTTDKSDNITAYDTYTAFAGDYSTGQSPYYDAGSLVAGTLYYFNVEIQNACGTSTGGVQSFTTESSVGSPSNATVVPSSTSVVISWTKGAGATNTHVLFKSNACSDNETDGTLIYSSTASTYTHTGLTPGTDYCYYIVGQDPVEGYSTNAITIHATTLAPGYSADTTGDTIENPSTMTQSPEISATLEENIPLFQYTKAASTSSGMPHSYLLFVLFILAIFGLSFGVNAVFHSIGAVLVFITFASWVAYPTIHIPLLFPVFVSLVLVAWLVMKSRSIA